MLALLQEILLKLQKLKSKFKIFTVMFGKKTVQCVCVCPSVYVWYILRVNQNFCWKGCNHLPFMENFQNKIVIIFISTTSSGDTKYNFTI